MPLALVSEAFEPEQGLDHESEALTRRHLHAHTGLPLARVPPVVPHARLDGGRLALLRMLVLPSRFTVSSPSRAVKRSTSAG